MNRSERPFIFNHMEISLDGKIMGKYLWIPETNTESDPFYRTIFGPDAKFTFQAIVEGRTTIEDNQTGYAVGCSYASDCCPGSPLRCGHHAPCLAVPVRPQYP